MKEQLLRLANRIESECIELNRVVDRVQSGWQQAQRLSDDLYLDSVALNLHGFYAGLERLFELTAATIDGSIPQGANWHQVLLNSMAIEITTVRPAVISGESKDLLDEYRGFRHIVRNVYTYKFDPAKVQKLVEKMPLLFKRIQAELLAFADFLEGKANANANDKD